MTRSCLLVGAVLVVAGALVRPPGAVTLSVHARHDPGAVYWRGALSEPRIRDAATIRQRLINGYRSPPLPFPERVPPYRARLEMILDVDEEGDYGFELEAPDWFGYAEISGVRVFGDGPFQPGASTAGSMRLDAGQHRLVLVVQPRAAAEGSIALLWRPPGRGLARLGPGQLVPGIGPRDFFREGRVGGVFGVGIALLLAGAVFLAVSEVGFTRRHHVVLLGAGVLVVSFVVRFAHFDTVPRQNTDEFHNAWAGLNLLQTGKPSSWSWLPGQEKEFIPWFDYGYPYVEYAFDHPPALPILIGATSVAMGVKSIFECVLPVIRLPMVVLGSFTVCLVLVLGFRVLGARAGMWSAFLMAVSPLSVFNSRLVKEDNLTQFWTVAAVLLYAVSEESRRGQIASGIAAGMAAFSKMMGLATTFALAALAVVDSKDTTKRLGRVVIPAVAVAALYPLYGLVVDWEAFSATFTHLAVAYPDESLADKGRIVARLLLEPKVNNNAPFFDGWILFGWLSLYLLRDKLQLMIPFVSYVLILLVTVRADSLWGFYSIPLYPFLFLAAGRHLERIFEKQDFFSSFALISLCIVPIVLSSETLSFAGALSFRLLMTVAFVPLVPAALGKARAPRLWRANRWLLAVLVIAALFASVERCLTTA